ncbi:hypothetical protein LIER_23179 [Lithospermum erythrorhizon]|uniref:Uncharacterized protein n=1 Tax=Lithospermum erythrorhizon TaxID=34254 RepID=A0AAV3R062_LITER
MPLIHDSNLLATKVENGYPRMSPPVTSHDNEDNIPGFHTLSSALEKLDKNIEDRFKRIWARLDELEKKVSNVEKSIPNAKKIEFHVHGRIQNIFAHDLDTFKRKLAKELREELKLQLPIYGLDGDELAKAIGK